jgi:hypothetical protein
VGMRAASTTVIKKEGTRMSLHRCSEIMLQ